VPGLRRSRILLLALAALTASSVWAADGSVATTSPTPPSYILVGFVGGFVRHDNPNQGPVQFARRTQATFPRNSYVHVFENRHRKTAYNTIVKLLDGDRNGVLSDHEKSQAHIILFGHSWGGSAVVLLARELDRVGVPVLLTVQVDSVRKPWQHDEVIPENVAAAVNFFQRHGLIHGRPIIRAANDAKTQIIGNFRFDYRKSPVKCEMTSWFDRTFTPDHMQSECDPHLWQQVDTLVRQQFQLEPESIASGPQP
jgi:pimeloyl-ACP methyl ester carboxylesterase